MINELGIDRSGNNNTWTVNNMTLAVDQMLDSPTNNFCTLNPLANELATTLSEGNLKSVPTGHNDLSCFSTFGFLSGKWYVEVHDTNQGDAAGGIVGISSTKHAGNISSGDDNSHIRMGNGLHTTTGTDNGDTTAGVTGDIFTIAVNADIGSVWYAKNAAPDVSTTAQATGLDLTPPRDYRFGHQESNSGHTSTTWNFGQDSSFAGTKTAQGNQDSNDIGDFYYTPPTDYLALCTSNLPAVAVVPQEHFNTVIYTGNETARSITGVGFQPDLVWIKQRSASARNHIITDAVRGVNKSLYADIENPEATDTDRLTAFGADGFSLGDGDYVNGIGDSPGDTYVAWNWKGANATVTNTAGSIDTEVSANADAGFSLISWVGDGTGSSYGHGLTKAPEMIIARHRGDTSWYVYNTNFPSPFTEVMYLDVPNSKATSTVYTATSSTTFTVDSGALTTDTQNYIAYCFHSVDGYSKVGAYKGNGSGDGTFIYTGFRPAFVLIKVYTTSEPWSIRDSVRSPENLANEVLKPDNNAAELTTGFSVDLLSNGFKCRQGGAEINDGSHSYIYLAFAETPFKYSNAR